MSYNSYGSSVYDAYLGSNESLQAGLKVVDPLLVELGQLQQQKLVGFVEPVFGRDEGSLGFRSLGHVGASFLHFVDLLVLRLELQAFAEKMRKLFLMLEDAECSLYFQSLKMSSLLCSGSSQRQSHPPASGSYLGIPEKFNAQEF